MEDVLGKELKIGDVVLCIFDNKLEKAKVVGFTEAKIRVIRWCDGSSYTKYPRQTVLSPFLF